MSDHFLQIYTHQAEQYERLIAREDQHGNIFAALMEIHPLEGTNIVEFGAGTGRLTRIMSILAKQIYSFDLHEPMLKVGSRVLTETGMENWFMGTADNRAMPIVSGLADIAIEGWSFGHVMGWYPEDWESKIDLMLAEMQRVLKPGGTMILLETMGTGQREPMPPAEHLATLYRYWEEKYGLQYRWIRTDYHFKSVEEADELIRFFFGDEMADHQVEGRKVIVPECTGIWWKTI